MRGGLLPPQNEPLVEFVSVAVYNKVVVENNRLKKTLHRLEKRYYARSKKGRSNSDKTDWTAQDYMNDHKVRDFCHEYTYHYYS